MADSLEDRVKQFLATYPGAELIDDLVSPSEHIAKRRADYFLENRRIILELKTLSVDTSPKAEKEIDKHRDREDFPIMYGVVELQQVLKHLPDGPEINRRIFNSMTRSVEDAVRSAEEQIDHTKEIFRLPDSVGMLVMLNEGIDSLAPDVVGYKVAQLIRRERKTSGTPSSIDIDYACLIFESHVVRTPEGVDAHPILLVEGRRAGSDAWFDPFFEKLQEAWARSNAAPAISMSSGRFEDLKFHPEGSDGSALPSELTRQQLWQRMYDAHPDLRELSDEEVLAHGTHVFGQLAPHFLKGGPRATREEMLRLLQAVTCFLREANKRGLDLRRMPKPTVEP
jgi:hypothetical protein